MKDLSALRVLEVDDSSPWRLFVTTELRKNSVHMIAVAADGLEGVQKARALQPDIVILDIWLPKLNGLEAIREISTVAPAARTLIVSNEADPEIVRAAFEAGARGYVLKSMAATDLVKAIEAIVRGEVFTGRGLTPCDADTPCRNK